MVKERRYVTNLELALEIRNLPGAVVECGVWRGGMIAGIASLLGNERRYHLFDSFRGLPPAEDIDGGTPSGQSAVDWQAVTGHNCAASEDKAIEAMALAGVDNYRTHVGWFSHTLPGDEGYPDGIALLRLDGDWYSSTTEVLESLFPYVNPGGLVIIDDYWYWDGCALAVHGYLHRHSRYERIEAEGSRRPADNRVAFMVKRPDPDTAAPDTVMVFP